MTLLSTLWRWFLYVFSKKELAPLLKASRQLKTFEDRSRWFQRLVRWISWERRPHREFDDPALNPQAARLGFLIQVLERSPEDRKAFGIQLWALLSESTSQELFSEVGLVRERGFFTELASRLWRYVLPVSARENDLTMVFNTSLGTLRTAEWVEGLPLSQVEYLARVIGESALDPARPFPGLLESISEALLILGANIASVGVSRHVLQRCPKKTAHESAFVKLNQCLTRVSESLRGSKDSNLMSEIQAIEGAAKECHHSIEWVLEQIERSGVSVHLVYDLESLQSWIKRALTLVRMVAPNGSAAALMTQFIGELAREGVAKRSVLVLIEENIHILSRKIVERTGISGEHYITKGISDYVKMLYQAMGGGILTAFTTVGKYLITIRHLPLFFDGFFVGLNYATSFVFIQLFHFTLATKQPSMTAPNLAGKLLQFERDKEIMPFIEEVARIARSQWISVIGNLSAVIPMAFFVDKLCQMRIGHTVYTVEYANYTLHALDPLHSLTIVYAILTGIILWLSSICAGWFENWIVYENIPSAIAASRKLQIFVGKKGAERVGRWFLKQSAGFAGNISLGFLLAYFGVFSKFFGVPLDVRHVTLSAGSLALAASSLFSNGSFELRSFGFSLLGIFLIGFLNVSTSFLLALYVAARARKVHKGALGFLLRRVIVTFLSSPLQFFYPVKSKRAV